MPPIVLQNTQCLLKYARPSRTFTFYQNFYQICAWDSDRGLLPAPQARPAGDIL